MIALYMVKHQVREGGLVSLGIGVLKNMAWRPGHGPVQASSGLRAGSSPPGRRRGELRPYLVLGA